MKNGQLILLENVRFYKEEEKNDAEFSKKVRGFVETDLFKDLPLWFAFYLDDDNSSGNQQPSCITPTAGCQR